ncbi:regulatory LuxR family protein [Chitinophaga skermanii]|uniref:Regulatory LuxR family protein n=2 Tax=Chitinophaga skermanii TaxID=331697 RepID=A0A327R208_9BACT|nr:regulatory LuxR family protein [Chitinophaga skermanii]
MVQHHETHSLQELLKERSSDYFNRVQTTDNQFNGLYILDYTKGKYLFANKGMESLSGYPPGEFLNGGLNFTCSLWNDDDFKVFHEKVHTENLRFLKETPVSEHGNFLFTCNYRIKNKRGEYRNVLQQSVYLQSSITGEPLATMGSVTDITALRLDGRITHTIEPLTAEGAGTPVVKNVHYAQSDNMLSHREMEIVKLICEGFSSSEIAKKLYISIYTVHNHRQNIMQKTNSRNVADIIKYAIKNGWL